MVDNTGVETDDPKIMSNIIQDKFNDKWQTLAPQKKHNILDFLMQYEGLAIPFNEGIFEIAAQKIKYTTKLDYMYVCVAALQF